MILIKVQVYIASSINRLLKGKYGYGNQLSSTKLKNEDFFIELPFKMMKYVLNIWKSILKN